MYFRKLWVGMGRFGGKNIGKYVDFGRKLHQRMFLERFVGKLSGFSKYFQFLISIFSNVRCAICSHHRYLSNGPVISRMFLYKRIFFPLFFLGGGGMFFLVKKNV